MGVIFVTLEGVSVMFIAPPQRALGFGIQDKKPQVRRSVTLSIPVPGPGKWGTFMLDGKLYQIELNDPTVRADYERALKYFQEALNLRLSIGFPAALALLWVKRPKHQRHARHEVRHPHKPGWVEKTVMVSCQAEDERLREQAADICRRWVRMDEEKQNPRKTL
jgi:hypothetical protein